jgi:hypothetical protein
MLSFGNMTLKMNVFNICKQPGDDNNLQEVNFIQKLVYDQFENTSSEIVFNKSENLQMVYFQEKSKASNWRPKIKELPPRSIESIPSDANQPNTKHNHANDPMEVPVGSITRARAKKLKEALNELIQNIWSKMDLEGLGTFKEHEGQPLIHIVQVQEKPNSCGTRG